MEKQYGTFHNIPEYVIHLSKELEIEGAEGLTNNEMELIALVRNCPFLFDKSYPDFRNAEKKNEAWEAIAKVFNVHVSKVKSQWNFMKDMFMKYNDKVKSDPSIIPSYSFFEELKFLEPFLPKKKSVKKKFSSKEESNESESTEQEYCFSQSSVTRPVNVEMFINTLKKEPILYDRKHVDFKNNDLKIKAWKRLSKEVKSSVPECVNRFKVLRDKYAKERKLAVKKWELFDKLHFLDQHIVSKKRYSYTHMQGLKSNSYNNVASSTDSVRDKICIDSSNEMPEAFASEMRTEVDNSTNYLRDEVAYPVEYNDSQMVQQNEDELFGLAIAAELKKVPDSRRKMKLKADIYKLLYDRLQL